MMYVLEMGSQSPNIFHQASMLLIGLNLVNVQLCIYCSSDIAQSDFWETERWRLKKKIKVVISLLLPVSVLHCVYCHCAEIYRFKITFLIPLGAYLNVPITKSFSLGLMNTIFSFDFG